MALVTQNTLEKVWYFGYGSNIKSVVMEGRGIKVLARKVVYVPSHKLNFEVFGVPYSEPAMASISTRGEEDDHNVYPVYGIASLISPADYQKLILSEGASTAYKEVELEAVIIGEGVQHELSHMYKDEEHTGVTLRVCSLTARYPFRPHNPARPSERYLNLLIEGAIEQGLPAAYITYLKSLPVYSKPMTRGGSIFQALWMPLIRRMMRALKKPSSAENEKSQRWAGAMVWLVFSAMWIHHDWIHSKLVGAGDGT